MRYFTISIDGVPPVERANKFWVEIARYEVNFMVLDRSSFIYGYANDNVIDILYDKAKKLGFKLDIEKGVLL